jgi:DNA-binding transcriptional MerR regulator
VPYKEKQIEKLYYSIGEVAKMFDVSNSLIRFWENEFDILQPRKNRKGDRLFTQADINNLQIIFHLVKERGYTLEGAKKKLRDNKDETIGDIELYQRLGSLKEFLENLYQSI